jgi:membrane-associated phospholipid phosphatase
VLPVNRRQTLPLVAALACLLGLVVVALLVLDVSAVRVRDRAILHGFVGLDRPSVHSEINVLAHLCDPLPYALAGLACVGVALARRRGWRSLAVLSLLVVTGATTQALKHVLAHPRFTEWLGTDNQISATAWPSGHSTAAMTLALCAVLVAPPAWRLAAGVVGGTFAATSPPTSSAASSSPGCGRRWRSQRCTASRCPSRRSARRGSRSWHSAASRRRWRQR